MGIVEFDGREVRAMNRIKIAFDGDSLYNYKYGCITIQVACVFTMIAISYPHGHPWASSRRL